MFDIQNAPRRLRSGPSPQESQSVEVVGLIAKMSAHEAVSAAVSMQVGESAAPPAGGVDPGAGF